MNSSSNASPPGRPPLDRRGFVTSLAALGATATLPGIAAGAESAAPTPGGGAPPMDDALKIAALRNETTRQLTTFNLDRKSKTIPIPRSKRVTIGEVKGEGYIAQFWLTFPGWFWQHWNPKAAVNQSILKTLILRIYFDDSEKPAVAAPVGDFFGAGLCEVASFASLYFGTSSGGFFCKWPMPFRKSFRVELENLDPEINTDVFCNLLYQLAPLPEGVGYFHAHFHTGFNKGPGPVQITEAHGCGHYAGCQLYMQGEERNYLSFLEAPEYVYVDNDWEKPRIAGTGLEDYFLGGWYFREGPIAGPYHGVTIKDTLNSNVAMYRVHETDAIHFQERLKFAFVNPWSPDRLKPFCFSSVAFLYLDKPDGQSPDIPSAKDLMCWYRIRNTDHLSVP
ncbi:MAG: glycoside hydrolase family 172 protein [Verrucomicrobiota bacterium]